MRVLVLGYGSMGQRHVQNAIALGHEVHAYDPAAPAAPVPGLRRWHMSEQSARRCKPDAVVIATPAATHADLLARWDAEAIRVLVEKPVALSCRDYWRPRAHARVAAAVAVGYHLRFHPLLRALQAWAAARPDRDPLQLAHAHLACDGRTWPGRMYAETLLECSHEVDVLGWLCGGALLPVDATRLHQDGWRAAWSLSGIAGPRTVRVSATLSTTHEGGYQRWLALTTKDGLQAGWGWHVPSGQSLLVLPDQPERTAVVDVEACYARELEAFLEGDWEAEHGCSLGAALATLAACDKAATLAARLSPVA